MQREMIIPGQVETSIETTLIAEGQPAPFVAMVVSGPEQAICLRLNEPTLGDLIRQLTELRTQLKNIRR